MLSGIAAYVINIEGVSARVGLVVASLFLVLPWVIPCLYWSVEHSLDVPRRWGIWRHEHQSNARLLGSGHPTVWLAGNLVPTATLMILGLGTIWLLANLIPHLAFDAFSLIIGGTLVLGLAPPWIVPLIAWAVSID